MKKVISFDLDGTLVDGKYGDLVWNHGIPEEYGRQYSVPFEEARGMIRREYEAVGDGDITWYDIEVWLQRFNLSVSAEELLDRYASHIELLPHARTVLESLKDRYTLVVASNAARIFVEKETSVAGLTGYFSHIISATTDYLTIKKEETFFRKLLDTVGVSPEEMVHIGDHVVYDYEVPSRLGIESYHFTQEPSAMFCQQEETNGHRVIRSLKELLDRL